MSYASILARAAKQAQAILAPLADASGTGRFTLGGASYSGTISNALPQLKPTLNGYEEIEQVTIVATKAQFAAAPDAATRPKLTMGGTQYLVTAVADDAVFYYLTCVVA